MKEGRRQIAEDPCVKRVDALLSGEEGVGTLFALMNLASETALLPVEFFGKL